MWRLPKSTQSAQRLINRHKIKGRQYLGRARPASLLRRFAAVLGIGRFRPGYRWLQHRVGGTSSPPPRSIAAAVLPFRCVIFAFAIGAPLFGEWVHVGIAYAVSVSVDLRLGVARLGLGSIAVACRDSRRFWCYRALRSAGLRRRERWRLAFAKPLPAFRLAGGEAGLVFTTSGSSISSVTGSSVSLVRRWMAFSRLISAASTSAQAIPPAPALAVRPMRCT